MKIGAGGLQSQLIEDNVKTQQVDPSRNRPGHEDTTMASQAAGKQKIKRNIINRPVEELLKNAEMNNHVKVKRRQEETGRGRGEHEGKKGDAKARDKKAIKKLDAYV